MNMSSILSKVTLIQLIIHYREALNNCIAHQDYTKGCRINVIEDDQLG